MIKTDIKTSAGFKTQTFKAITSIVLFFITYVAMLALAVGLTALCIYAGLMLIAIKPMFITIALGIGLASLGVLVLFFLLKFVFKSNKVDRSHLTEIKKAEEPQLFKLIEDIVQQVGTRFPKKVYLSAQVNASVFYDSGFWSMFLPVRKNLEIGLGLVNTVSHSEITAILSHEFGHFSQKTMKVGSYVYNVNQVIFNLLNDNESYDSMMQRWASASGYFSIFVVIAFKIIEGIKWVLKQMYGVVNKSYMALSREMEFHADEIAASVTGYEPLKSSLLRMSLADHSFNNILSFYEAKIEENKKAENIFTDHAFVMHFLAKDSGLQIKDHLPQVTEQQLNKFNKSKLVIKDQWASHPSTEERVLHLERTGRSGKSLNTQLANTLFTNIENTQKALTNNMFNKVAYTGEVSTISSTDFQSEFSKNFLENTFPKVYNGYYDNKNPLFFDVEKAENSEAKESLEELFSEDKIDAVYTAIALNNDIATLKQIADNTYKLKTFDYNGVKYRQKDSKNLVQRLELELEQLNENIKSNDIKIFQFCKAQEEGKEDTPTLATLYKAYFNYDKAFDEKYAIYTKLSEELQFINYTTPFDQIRANLHGAANTEKDLKRNIRELLEDPQYQEEITQQIRTNFELYLSKDWEYFGHEKYFDNNLQTLFAAMNNYAFLLSRGYFLLKKNLLNYQATLITI